MVNWAAIYANLGDPTYIPSVERTRNDANEIPSWYCGYIMMFNEPGQKEDQISDGSACILAEVAAAEYVKMVRDFPHAKIVVGGLFPWDSLNPETHEDRTDCKQKPDPNWRMHFIEALASSDTHTPIPEYWHIHGYVEPNNSEQDEVHEITDMWEFQMGPTMTANMIDWWNAVAASTYDITSYSPKYWITEYNSKRPDSPTPTVNGEFEFEDMFDWVNTELHKVPQEFPLERAAVFNNRCEYHATLRKWCNGFEPTNLLNWAGGNYLVLTPMPRGTYFMNNLSGQSLTVPEPEEEELQLNPYPYFEE